jgi:fumarate reductase subunit D
MLTILLVMAFVALLGILSVRPHSRRWGYAPSGVLSLVVLVLVVLVLSSQP